MLARQCALYTAVLCAVIVFVFIFLRFRGPPGSTPLYSSEASEVYKRRAAPRAVAHEVELGVAGYRVAVVLAWPHEGAVPYTPLPAHQTPEPPVSPLSLLKKKKKTQP